jgi:shikimate dehydrogenase
MKPSIGPATTLCMSLASRPGTFGTRFHNFLYDALGLDFLYKAFTTTDIAAAIGGVRALGIRGCAISMPFKEAVIPLLDALEASARAIDSVNTIVNDAGRLTGYNTDYSAVQDLVSQAGIAPATPFVLRGSGGMAKAVVAALRDLGFADGTIVARNEARGRALAARYGYAWRAGLPEPGAPFIVNVTPLGMAGPHATEMAFPAAAIDACTHALDVVALPVATPFLRHAVAAGKQVLSGADIAVLQALEQFVLYTGVRPTAAQVLAGAQFARQA